MATTLVVFSITWATRTVKIPYLIHKSTLAGLKIFWRINVAHKRPEVSRRSLLAKSPLDALVSRIYHALVINALSSKQLTDLPCLGYVLLPRSYPAHFGQAHDRTRNLNEGHNQRDCGGIGDVAMFRHDLGWHLKYPHWVRNITKGYELVTSVVRFILFACSLTGRQIDIKAWRWFVCWFWRT